MKIDSALEDFNILLKIITKTIENETKEQKYLQECYQVLLRDNFLGNMLTGKGILRAGYGNKERKEILRAGYGSKNF